MGFSCISFVVMLFIRSSRLSSRPRFDEFPGASSPTAADAFGGGVVTAAAANGHAVRPASAHAGEPGVPSAPASAHVVTSGSQQLAPTTAHVRSTAVQYARFTGHVPSDVTATKPEIPGRTFVTSAYEWTNAETGKNLDHNKDLQKNRNSKNLPTKRCGRKRYDRRTQPRYLLYLHTVCHGCSAVRCMQAGDKVGSLFPNLTRPISYVVRVITDACLLQLQVHEAVSPNMSSASGRRFSQRQHEVQLEPRQLDSLSRRAAHASSGPYWGQVDSVAGLKGPFDPFVGSSVSSHQQAMYSGDGSTSSYARINPHNRQTYPPSQQSALSQVRLTDIEELPPPSPALLSGRTIHFCLHTDVFCPLPLHNHLSMNKF